MIQSTIPQSSEVLFETTLELPSSAVDKLKKGSSVDEGEITILRGKKNKVRK